MVSVYRRDRSAGEEVVYLTNLHCLQRMRTPFELQNDFSVAILGLPKFFSGGRRNDRTDNANREQTLPHLRRG